MANLMYDTLTIYQWKKARTFIFKNRLSLNPDIKSPGKALATAAEKGLAINHIVKSLVIF